MGYYMRYIVSDERPVDVQDIRSAYLEAGIEYEVGGKDAEATIGYQGRTIGRVTLNVPGDGLFDEDLAELIERVQDSDEPAKQRVIDTLRAAGSIVAVEILFGYDEIDRTLDRLDPLWTWLRANRHGLLQASGEGYYDGNELILAVA